ncbi:MAG: glutamate--tRNA ligase family protein [Planctomycetota bacterium]
MADPSNKPVVTRFAPSPTGALHIGGARTALFAWAYARGRQGKFILRIEDTDLKRSSPESTRGIIRDMQWLGLDWDEGPSPDAADPYAEQLGDNGPYFQSQRAEQGIYDHYIQLLLDAGEAYEEEGAVRLKMGSHRGDITFDDAVFGQTTVTADNLEDFVIRKGADGGNLPTFHFAVVVDDALMGVTHVIRGQEHHSNTSKHAALYDALAKLTEDEVTWARPTWVHTPSIMNPGGSKMSKRDVAKAARKAIEKSNLSEQFPALSFERFFVEELAKLVPNATLLEDSIFSNGNIRADITGFGKFGQFLIEIKRLRNAEVHNQIQNQLDSYKEKLEGTFKSFIETVHDDAGIGSFILGCLQEETPEINVRDFRMSGYLQSALLNYIALLGWNPGDDQEKFDLDFLSQHFDFDRVGKANSTFDRAKLKSFNGDAIREMSAEDFACELAMYVKAYRPTWEDNGIFNGDDWQAFCTAVQERAETLPQPLDANGYLIAEDDGIEYDFAPKPMRKAMINSDGAGIKLLEELRAAFDTLPEDDFGHAGHEKINELAESTGINMGKYAQPVRIAVSGSTVTPPLDVTLDLLGKSSSLERMDRCIAAAKAHLESQA